ncbi:MAG: tetratricopeptide repeat protein [Leptospiraceae bacterium]|nr:tetratricopeptide repeat protein [Leptospiraceae bacterium]
MKLSEAATRLGIPRYHLYYWKKIGLVGSGGEVSFPDLVKLRFIQRCRRNGISLQRIRRMVLEIQPEAKPGVVNAVHPVNPAEDGEPNARATEAVPSHAQKHTDPAPTGTEQNHPGGIENWHRHLELYGPGLLLQRESESLLNPDSGQLYFAYEARPAREEVVSLFRDQSIHAPHPALQKMEREYLDAIPSGDYRRIRRTLEKILEVFPGHLAAYIELGNLCYEFERFNEALDVYEQALEMDPDCVEALYNMANIHFRENRYAAAIRYFQHCIRLEPDFPEAYYNLGLLFYSLRYFEPAIECLNRYLELDAESDWSRQAAQLIEDMESQLRDQVQENNFSLFRK